MRFWVISVLSVGLAGCVSSPATVQRQAEKRVPLSTPEQVQEGYRSYYTCLVSSAARLDDHTSDAATIAQAMRGSCYPEVLKVAAATTGGEPVNRYYEECDRLIANENQPELQAVLDERRTTTHR